MAAALGLAFFSVMPLWLNASAARSLISITDPNFIQDCVDMHNSIRGKVHPSATNMFAMTWDEALAKSARAWSKTCQFKHNPSLQKKGVVHPTFFPIGENIFVSTGRFNAKRAIKRWSEEVADYDYSRNTCKPKKVCGHYTQVAWASTYKVGCSVTECPKGVKGSGLKGPSVHFVCNYAPAGNYIRTLPYVSGASCTSCSNCQNKLCRDAKRDRLIKYPNWDPDFGSASISSCGQFLPLTSIIVIYILQ